MMKYAAVLVVALVFAGAAPVQAQRVGGNASLSVTSASANVAFPASTATYPSVLLVPAPGSAQEIFYQTGSGSVAATTSSPSLPSGGVCINIGPDTNVAAITASSTATLRITQVNTCANFAGGGSGSGGGSTPVGTFDAAPQVIPTIQNAAYASGNAVGALQSVALFRTTAQPSGILNGWLLGWKGTETTALTFYVFDTSPTGSTCTDKSAFSLAAADVPKLAIVPFTLTAAAPAVGTTTTYATASFTPTSVHNGDGSATLNMYVCAVSGGTFTPAVGDLFYKPAIAQD